ncbi:DUF2092 domain-containing protein [Shimia sp. W99]
MLRKISNSLALLGAGHLLFVAGSTVVKADETDAILLLRAMSAYIGGLESFSIDFDAEHELVSTDGEKFGLRSSGHVAVRRPDRLSISRNAGFSELDFLYNGQNLTVQDSTSGLRTTLAVAGGIDALIDELRDTHGRPLPAADLIASAAYDVLMEDVTEIKDLGVGVVNGITCDHLAFRKPHVDWQIWIAQGEAPYPCLMVITTRDIAMAPRYSVSVKGWTERADDIPEGLMGKAFTDVDIGTFLAEAPGFPSNYVLEDSK